MYSRLPGILNIEALRAVRSAITVVDATDPELPIVYMNPAFTTLTGYDEDEVIGRNCRFLQGTDTEQPPRRVVREAVSQQRPVRVIIRNYRKDGSLFHNELLIDPILDAKGDVSYLVGCQNEIRDSQVGEVLEPAQRGFDQLTDRERQVFKLIVNGHSNKSTARELRISPRTTEKHRTAILKKFEVSDTTLLVRYAIALGIPFQSHEPAPEMRRQH